MKNQIKIAIADDHPIMIDGIKTALAGSTEIKIVGEAYNGLEIIEIVKTKIPDLVLLDIRMPEMDGIDAAKIIKMQFKAIKIIMLTQFDERGFIRHCQKIGVEGYLLKDCGKAKLIETIKHIFNGGIYFNLANEKKENTYRLNCNAPKSLLSCRELDVLELFAKDFTNDQIAKNLGIELSTVKTYKQRLKQKSGTKTLSGLVSWAYQNKII